MGRRTVIFRYFIWQRTCSFSVSHRKLCPVDICIASMCRLIYITAKIAQTIGFHFVERKHWANIFWNGKRMHFYWYCVSFVKFSRSRKKYGPEYFAYLIGINVLKHSIRAHALWMRKRIETAWIVIANPNIEFECNIFTRNKYEVWVKWSYNICWKRRPVMKDLLEFYFSLYLLTVIYLSFHPFIHLSPVEFQNYIEISCQLTHLHTHTCTWCKRCNYTIQLDKCVSTHCVCVQKITESLWVEQLVEMCQKSKHLSERRARE